MGAATRVWWTCSMWSLPKRGRFRRTMRCRPLWDSCSGRESLRRLPRP
jgi:hypothetical protein